MEFNNGDYVRVIPGHELDNILYTDGLLDVRGRETILSLQGKIGRVVYHNKATVHIKVADEKSTLINGLGNSYYMEVNTFKKLFVLENSNPCIKLYDED